MHLTFVLRRDLPQPTNISLEVLCLDQLYARSLIAVEFSQFMGIWETCLIAALAIRVVTWDYDIHGGDSDVEIPLGQSLPANAIIKIPYFMGENLGVGGGGVTVALGCGSQQLTTDQSSPVSNFNSGSSVWDAVLDNGGSGDTKMLVADGGELKLLIKGNPLVSGKITWFIEFVVKQDTIDVQ
jgi:hypothetical protein